MLTTMASGLTSASVSPDAYMRANNHTAQHVLAVLRDIYPAAATNVEIRRRIPGRMKPALSRVRHGIAALRMSGKIVKLNERAKSSYMSAPRAQYQYLPEA